MAKQKLTVSFVKKLSGGQLSKLTEVMTNSATMSNVHAQLIVSTGAEGSQDTLIVVGEFDVRTTERLNKVLQAITENGGMGGFKVEFDLIPDQK